jgi:hypothetical protein
MKKFRWVILGVSLAGTSSLGLLIAPKIMAVENTACTTNTICNLSSASKLSEVIDKVPTPDIKTPDWMQAQIDAAASVANIAVAKHFTYNVQSKGAIVSDLSEFERQISETLADARGWVRAGVSFSQVAGGGNFTLVLSEASQVLSFAPGACSTEYSCRVGSNVIINQDRWSGATSSWNSAGGTLRDYRHMVINHEVGHWLGHDHLTCGGAGQPAPLMQQQSIDLQGCTFNAWPLAGELWTSR